MAATRASQRPFWKQTMSPSSASAGSAARAGALDVRRLRREEDEVAGALRGHRGHLTAHHELGSFAPQAEAMRAHGFEDPGFVVTPTTSCPASARCAATMPPTPPHPMTRKRLGILPPYHAAPIPGRHP